MPVCKLSSPATQILKRILDMSEQLDKLNSELAKLETKLATIKTVKINAERDYKDTLDEILDIRRHIDELNKVANATIRVTDHAVLRYLERFKAFDKDPIVQEILNRIDIDNLRALGGNIIIRSVAENMKIVIENFTVITITTLK